MVDTRALLEKGPVAEGSARRAGGREGRKQLRATPVSSITDMVRKAPSRAAGCIHSNFKFKKGPAVNT